MCVRVPWNKFEYVAEARFVCPMFATLFDRDDRAKKLGKMFRASEWKKKRYDWNRYVLSCNNFASILCFLVISPFGIFNLDEFKLVGWIEGQELSSLTKIRLTNERCKWCFVTIAREGIISTSSHTHARTHIRLWISSMLNSISNGEWTSELTLTNLYLKDHTVKPELLELKHKISILNRAALRYDKLYKLSFRQFYEKSFKFLKVSRI